MIRRATPGFALLALFVAAGCTIDIPQSYYQDSASAPADTGKSDGVPDTTTSDVPVVDAAKDSGSPPDSALPDVPPVDGAIADGATDVPHGADGADAPDTEPVDIVVGDVSFPPVCTVDEDCVPSGPLPECVVGRCIDGACSPGAMPDGEPCDEPGQEPTACVVEQCKAAKCRLVELGVGVPCGVTDACFEDRCNAAGLCVAVSLVSCDDENPCTADSCDPVTGCKSAPQVGAGCDDGDNCTEKDSCLGDGTCAGVAMECTADPCHKAACDPETGTCVQTPDVGALCDDGDKCTTFDKCTSSGVCAGNSKCAKPTNPCHKAVCSPEDGSCTPVPAVGQACNDGNACTVPDICECPPATICTLAAIQCVGQVVPIGRLCESPKDCGYKGSVCKSGVCALECDSAADCPQPPPNQGTAVCEPLGTPPTDACGIVKCITSAGKPGQCVDGACL